MDIVISLGFAIVFVTSAAFVGSFVGRKIGGLLHGSEVKTVEVVKDTEANLRYRIEIGRTRGLLHRRYFWRLSAERCGNSRLTGQMSINGAILEIEVEGVPSEMIDMHVGANLVGGPVDSRDDALSLALNALESVR